MNERFNQDNASQKGKKMAIFALVILAIFLGASINWFLKKEQNARKGTLIEVDNTKRKKKIGLLSKEK